MKRDAILINWRAARSSMRRRSTQPPQSLQTGFFLARSRINNKADDRMAQQKGRDGDLK